MFSTIHRPSLTFTWITLSLLPSPMSTNGSSSAPMWTAVGAFSVSVMVVSFTHPLRHGQGRATVPGMKQLSGLDATFLYMETPSQFGHVSSLSIFARPDDAYEPFSAWRTQIEQRLHLLEPLRRRLVPVPFSLDHPFWIEDPDFDLDFHVR